MSNEYVPGGKVGNIVNMETYLGIKDLPRIASEHAKVEQAKADILAQEKKLAQEKATQEMVQGTAPGL
jgi:hypothetical protein